MPNPPKKLKKKWSELSFWGKAGRIGLWALMAAGAAMLTAGVVGGLVAAAAVTGAASAAVPAVWGGLTLAGAITLPLAAGGKVAQKATVDRLPNPAYVAPAPGPAVNPPIITNPVTNPAQTNAPVVARRVGQFNRGMPSPRVRQSTAGQQFVQPQQPTP